MAIYLTKRDDGAARQSARQGKSAAMHDGVHQKHGNLIDRKYCTTHAKFRRSPGHPVNNRGCFVLRNGKSAGLMNRTQTSTPSSPMPVSRIPMVRALSVPANGLRSNVRGGTHVVDERIRVQLQSYLFGNQEMTGVGSNIHNAGLNPLRSQRHKSAADIYAAARRPIQA